MTTTTNKTGQTISVVEEEEVQINQHSSFKIPHAMNNKQNAKTDAPQAYTQQNTKNKINGQEHCNNSSGYLCYNVGWNAR